MLDFNKDLKNTLLRKTNKMKCYDSLYYSSNEDFDGLFSQFNLKDKSILSIIGSRDQAFYFYNMGCESVDLYDINIVTIYYYFLRLWCIKYMGDLYPDLNLAYVRRLLSNVQPSNPFEENACNYWIKMMNIFEFDYELESLFFIGSVKMLEKYINDNSFLIQRIMSKNINFTPMDITKPINLEKKYDMVFVSNISEYIKSNHQFRVFSDNLEKVLKQDGVVVGSNVMRVYPQINEIRILSKNFDFHEIKSSTNRSFFPGFYYTKKR